MVVALPLPKNLQLTRLWSGDLPFRILLKFHHAGIHDFGPAILRFSRIYTFLLHFNLILSFAFLHTRSLKGDSEDGMTALCARLQIFIWCPYVPLQEV
jgi:hypothetical protein